MSRIVVIGAGACGLAAALMLARDGHETLVLERDPDPVPGSVEVAWESWKRNGVVQFRQPHFMHARSRHVLDAELPDVRDAFAAAGGLWFDYSRSMPPGIAERDRRPEDARYRTLTGRRSTIEWVLAGTAAHEPRLEVRRGAVVQGLVTRLVDGLPHVEGVETEAGERIPADLVVDASGRRSAMPRWLEAAGSGRVDEMQEDCGFIYYSRYFRSRDAHLPELLTPTLSPIGSFSVLTVPADGGVWSVTIYVSSGDQRLKRLREPETWSRLIASCPLHAHWLEGEAITEVLPMGGVVDRYRRFWAGGRPLATGIAVVSDGLACTNPSLGRGLAFGFSHAARLRDVARAHLDNPLAFAKAWDRVAEAEVAPWYHATVAADRARLAEIEAFREGRTPPRATDPTAAALAAIAAAAPGDPEVLRGSYEISGCLELPLDVYRRPGYAERVARVGRGRRPFQAPGPDRATLLELVG